MDTTVEALKTLYTALGGDSSAVANYMRIPDIVNAIATLISSGATAELPEVTTEDNGKVLTVVDGEWTAATPE